MSPLLKPQKRRPLIRGCHVKDVEGETSMNIWRGFQLNVEKIEMDPSSHALARDFPSGENSKAAIDSFSPVRVVSYSYRRVDMRKKDVDRQPRGTCDLGWNPASRSELGFRGRRTRIWRGGGSSELYDLKPDRYSVYVQTGEIERGRQEGKVQELNTQAGD